MPLPTTDKGLVTVFGGTGFLGRHVVRALLKRGWRVRAAVRRPDLAGHLQPLGMVGWVQPVQANVRYRWSIERAVEGADAVVNLVAILSQRGRQTYEAVNVVGTQAIAEATRAAGIGRFVHVSAIGADEDSPSAFYASKSRGEAAARATIPGAIVFRPATLFGPEDRFFNRIAGMARFMPALPLFGGGGTRLQPAFVGDVARAIADAVDGKVTPGTLWELGGPDVRTLRQCFAAALAAIDRRRLLVPVPFALGVAKGAVLQYLPGQLLTADQVRQLRVDAVVSEAAGAEGRTFAGLGIEPDSLDAILPTYLWRFRPRGQFERQRTA